MVVATAEARLEAVATRQSIVTADAVRRWGTPILLPMPCTQPRPEPRATPDVQMLAVLHSRGSG